jgi:hypothetical protein
LRPPPPLQNSRHGGSGGVIGSSESSKKLLFLLLDVVLHHFAQDTHLGVVKFLTDFHRLNLGDQVLYGRMFDDRFVDQIIVLGCFPGLGIKDLFFHLRVNLQRQADLSCELGLLIIILI